VTGIDYPVFLGFDPEGALYLTYPAFGPDAGQGLGALLRIDPAAMPVDLSGIGAIGPSCMGGPGAAPALASPEAAASGDAADSAAEGSSVTIVDFAFDPPELAVAAGTTVTWTNEDWAPHTVTASGGEFDSGRIDTDGTFSQTFEEPGEYGYFCAFHPGMTGSVAVT
jgi:plastocyanin